MNRRFTGGTLVLPDRLVGGAVDVAGGRIVAVHERDPGPFAGDRFDLAGGYLAPGFVDLHVHGGAGADFMDGTEEAFRAVCRAHARHGTTSLLPTSTAARHEQILPLLEPCRPFQAHDTRGARRHGR